MSRPARGVRLARLRSLSPRAKLGWGCGGCCGLLVLLGGALLTLTVIVALIAPTPSGDMTAAPSAGAVQSASPSTTTPAPSTTAPVTPSATPSPMPSAAPDPHTAVGVLAALPVGPRGAKTGYDRALFDWRQDTDRNGCDTRNDVLRRDLTAITVTSESHGCVVTIGTLTSPYSGARLAFVRDSSAVDVDHVVALSDAWQSGADALPGDQRVALANDPLNLLAVEHTLNQQKSDGDAATWLPPRTAYRCEYVARQIAVKAKYRLRVKPAEKTAMEHVLSACPGQAAFTSAVTWPASGKGDHVQVASATPTAAPTTVPPTPRPTPAPTPVHTTPAPTRDTEPTEPEDDADPVVEDDSAGGGPVVHPGSFCSGEGSVGVTAKGKPMVCGVAKGGRLRWIGA